MFSAISRWRVCPKITENGPPGSKLTLPLAALVYSISLLNSRGSKRQKVYVIEGISGPKGFLVEL
jgi:hypothetical protein